MTENQPSADFPRDLLRQIATTKESRQLLADLIPEMLRLWAESGTGTGPTRKIARQSIAGLAGSSVKNAFLDKKGLREAARLQELAADPEFVQAAATETGAALDAVFESLAKALADLEKLDPEQKVKLVETIFTNLGTGRGAPLITSACRIISDIHQQDQSFLARTLEPGFNNWVARLDFAAVKEMLDTSAEGMAALVTMINTVLWQYPAKVVTTLSFLPPIINMMLDSLAGTVKTFNDKGSPDLVADILLSLLRELNTDSLAAVINELAEQTRRFHTGSALIGEPGSPQMPNDVFVLLNDTLGKLDGRTLWKAKIALAEIKETAANALTDALAEHPEMMMDGIKHASAIHNTRLRAANHRLTVSLDDVDPEAVNNALADSASGFDAQEAAETINNAVALLNRFLTARPEVITEKAGAFAEALDPYELSGLLDQAGSLMNAALKPLARSIVPHLIKGLLATLEPDDDELGSAAASAREMLLSFFNSQEAHSNE